MIISRTPYRVSFFGGGTDYPGWFQKHGGSVLSVTIDKYCYLTCRYLPPFFDHRLRVVYSRIENPSSVDEIEHPAVREALKYMGINRGLCIQHDGDLPARSGAGSSSSFAVGLLHALHALQGKMPTKMDLAKQAIHIEQEVLKETVGSQDQVAAAFGGLNHITFLRDGEFIVRPVTVPHARMHELQSHLMLFYTGIKRTATAVAKTYVDDLDSRSRQLRLLGQFVEEAISILAGGRDLREFGELLHEGWMCKRSMGAKVSNPAVDHLYDTARGAGAIGGKLLGAGGGGLLLLFAPPDCHARIRAALDDVIYVPFDFEQSGSQIVVYDAERDYAALDDLRSKSDRPKFTELDADDPLARKLADHDGAAANDAPGPDAGVGVAADASGDDPDERRTA